MEEEPQKLFILNYVYESGEKFFGVFNSKEKAEEAKKETGLFDMAIFEINMNECFTVQSVRNQFIFGKLYEEN